jgi:outer membrane receptor protein involved in Fe transport
VARGRLVFQTFNDFLLGLSADGNLGPSGRSNIQSVQASEGVGLRGEVQYHYRSYYGAAFLQNDYKVSPRLNLNLGVRWEYVGPALDTGASGRLATCERRSAAPARYFQHRRRQL